MSYNQIIFKLASQITSVEIFTAILIVLEEDQDYNNIKKQVIIDISFFVATIHPEFSEEICYLLNLFLYKHYFSKNIIIQ